MQLTYRGQAYNSSPETLPPAVPTGVTHTLFYRGSAYQCSRIALRSPRLLGVINWRFSGATVCQKKQSKPAH